MFRGHLDILRTVHEAHLENGIGVPVTGRHVTLDHVDAGNHRGLALAQLVHRLEITRLIKQHAHIVERPAANLLEGDLGCQRQIALQLLAERQVTGALGVAVAAALLTPGARTRAALLLFSTFQRNIASLRLLSRTAYPICSGLSISSVGRARTS